MIGKANILDRPKIDVEILTEEVTIGNILLGITAGIEVDKTFKRNFSNYRSRSRGRSPTPRRYGNM